MKLTFDFDELTVGDIEDFEDACGIPIFEVKQGSVPTKALAPLIWISERRNNPAFTLDDARKVRVSDLEYGDPPAEAGDGASTAGSRRSQSSTGTPPRKSAR